MKTRYLTKHRYTRAEFDWLACDSNGRIGYFTSAGAGPVPDIALTDGFLVGVFEYVTARPEGWNAVAVGEHSYNTDDFLAVARRGLCGFNWDFDRKAYTLVARPGEVVCGDGEIDRAVLASAQKVVIPTDFRQALILRVAGAD